jgi:hypothetical protein
LIEEREREHGQKMKNSFLSASFFLVINRIDLSEKDEYPVDSSEVKASTNWNKI